MKQKNWQKKAINRLYLVLSIFFLALISIFYIWLKVRVGLLADEVERLRRQEVQLIQQNYHLNGKIVQLSSYDRITKIAQQKLGLDFVNQEVISVKARKPAEKQ